MAKGREQVRRLVQGGISEPVDPPAEASTGESGTGTGGGLPENPEGRAASDFGPGGSGGPTGRGGKDGSQMRSPGGRTPGGARTGA